MVIRYDIQMKKVLFSHSYFLRFDPKQWETGLPYAPLGTLYAAAVMREQGYDVALHDVMFDNIRGIIIPASKIFSFYLCPYSFTTEKSSESCFKFSLKCHHGFP